MKTTLPCPKRRLDWSTGAYREPGQDDSGALRLPTPPLPGKMVSGLLLFGAR